MPPQPLRMAGPPWRRRRRSHIFRALLTSASLWVAWAAGAGRDYYETLGVDKSSSEAEIKRAHKKMALKWHPDKNPDQKEKAQKEFIEIQKAYEVLGDPDKRKRYDNQKSFFSDESEQWDGADNSANFEPPGDPFRSVDQLREALHSGEVTVLHVYADQRHFFGQWMLDCAQDVKLAHVHVFTVEEGLLQRLHVKRFPMFIILDGVGGMHSYVPTGWDFLNLADAVRQAVTEFVPYTERIQTLRNEADLDLFLKVHPTGSAKPRIVFFADDVRRRLLTAFNVAGKLQDTHHCAQLGAQRWVMERFKLKQVPAFLLIDPATRQGATTSPQIIYEHAEKVIEQIKDASILPEFSDKSFQDICKGEWDMRCKWVAIFLVPSAALGSEEAMRKALRRFREACKAQKEPIGCFWLRHNTEASAPWMEALRPLLAQEGVPDSETAKDTWVVAVNGAAHRATAFTKTVVDRELAQRDLVKWIQQVLISEPGEEGGPSETLDAMPPLPTAVEELYGPKGLLGRLGDRVHKFYNSAVEYAKESGGGSLQLLFFAVLIGWPMLSNQLNNLAKNAAGINPQDAQNCIPVGTTVVVDGLRQATEYNGQRGKVIAHMVVPGQPIKYRVQLRIGGEDKVIAVRADNLNAG